MLLFGRRSMMETLDFGTLFHFLLAILFQCTEVKYEEWVWSLLCLVLIFYGDLVFWYYASGLSCTDSGECSGTGTLLNLIAVVLLRYWFLSNNEVYLMNRHQKLWFVYVVILKLEFFIFLMKGSLITEYEFRSRHLSIMLI